jgi:hypothetical protein
MDGMRCTRVGTLPSAVTEIHPNFCDRVAEDRDLISLATSLLAGMNPTALGYHVTSHVTTASVMHVLIAKTLP